MATPRLVMTNGDYLSYAQKAITPGTEENKKLLQEIALNKARNIPEILEHLAIEAQRLLRLEEIAAADTKQNQAETIENERKIMLDESIKQAIEKEVKILKEERQKLEANPSIIAATQPSVSNVTLPNQVTQNVQAWQQNVKNATKVISNVLGLAPQDQTTVGILLGAESPAPVQVMLQVHRSIREANRNRDLDDQLVAPVDPVVVETQLNAMNELRAIMHILQNSLDQNSAYNPVNILSLIAMKRRTFVTIRQINQLYESEAAKDGIQSRLDLIKEAISIANQNSEPPRVVQEVQGTNQTARPGQPFSLFPTMRPIAKKAGQREDEENRFVANIKHSVPRTK